ncbi:MAG: hypothetical protein ACI934_001669, partial [Pseudohongiellaceae bacterium]
NASLRLAQHINGATGRFHRCCETVLTHLVLLLIFNYSKFRIKKKGRILPESR